MIELKEDQMSKINEMNEITNSLKVKENFLKKFELIDHKDDFIYQTSTLNQIKPPRKNIYYFQGHEVEGIIIKYNNNGNFFLSSGNEKVIKIWDSYSGVEKNPLRGFLQAILCISVSPLDDMILAGGSSGSAYLWSITNTKLKHTLTGHGGKINGVGFFRTNKEAVTASEDKTLKLWALDKGYCSKTISTPSIIHSLDISPDDMTIISGHKDGCVRLYTSNSNKYITCLDLQKSPISSCSISKCGNYLGVTSRDNVVIVQDFRMGKELWKLSHNLYKCPGSRASVNFSPDSRLITLGSLTGDIITWNVFDGTNESIITGWHQKPVLSVQWSPHESQISSIDSAGHIGVWY